MLPLTQTISPSQSGAWQLEWAGIKQASDEDIRNYRLNQRYLDPFDIPVLIDSKVIAITANYAMARPSWSAAGTLLRLADFPGLDDVLEDDMQNLSVAVLDRHPIRLNSEFEILAFNGSTSQLKLTFIPKPWIPEIGLAVYSYQGPVGDALLEGFAQLNSKIDSLISQSNP